MNKWECVMQFKMFQITYSTILINPLIDYNITAFYWAQPYGSAMHVCSAHAYICANAYICEAVSWVDIATQLAYNMSYYHCPHLQTKTASYDSF